MGTTVRLNGFLKSLPVRRQTAVKSSAKSSAKIKKLLQSYALARPSVRFSLKLLKAKNENGNWVYAPTAGDYKVEAARKIFGNHVVEQCEWKLWQPLQADGETLTAPDDASSVEGSYQIEALLPKSKYGRYHYALCYATHCLRFSDPCVVSNIGQFISVDSRPVSCSRGTFKQIVGLYKSYLGSGALIEKIDKPKDCILCMNIICPRSSYDVNVEPAKDDVLFTNVDFVLGMLEGFFKDMYGDIKTTTTKTTASHVSHMKPRGFEVLLARKKQLPGSIPDQLFPCLDSTPGDDVNISSETPVNILKPASTATESPSNPNSGRTNSVSGIKGVDSRSNSLHTKHRYLGGSTADIGFAEEHSPVTNGQTRWLNASVDDGIAPLSPLCVISQPSYARDWDGEEGLRDSSVSNPWTFAKINTPIRQNNTGQRANQWLLTPGYQTGELDEMIEPQVQKFRSSQKTNRHGLLTPQRTEMCQEISATFQASSPEPYPFSPEFSRGDSKNSSSSTHTRPERSRHDVGSLNTWIRRSPNNGPITTCASSVGGFDQKDQEIPSPSTRDFVSARTILPDTPRETFTQVDAKLTLSQSSPKCLARQLDIPPISPGNDPQDDWIGTDPRGTRKRHFPNVRGDGDTAPAAASAFAEEKNIDCTFQSKLSSSITSAHPDLAKALDYEVRKQAAVKQWRAKQSQQLLGSDLSQASQYETPGSLMQSPHQNRYRRALATLRQPVDGIETTPTPALNYNDPRAYLIRTQQLADPGAFSSGPRKRRKTSSLPLETVQEESAVRDLILNIDTKIPNVYKSAGRCASNMEFCDTYLTSGTISSGFSSSGLTTDLIRAWEGRVRELIKDLYKTDKSNIAVDRIEMRIDLWPLVQTHLAAHA